MSKLIIDNQIIDTPLLTILKKVRETCHNEYLKDMKVRGDNIRITCPFHKQGKENDPSCDVYQGDAENLEYGYYKCFTCGEQGSLPKLVAHCLNKSINYAKDWLIENFSNSIITYKKILPEITLKKETKKYLDENILDTFQNYHPYMEKRKLTKKIVDMFKVKYDKDTKCLVFPVWDENNNLVMLTRRSVESKKFIIPPDTEKPVYLLNYINRLGIKDVAVTESQINALTLWSIGIQAIALFGTGSKKQYEILNKSGIRTYYLFFDGDEAGDKGRTRFLKNIRNDVIVSTAILPRGKDVNDLSEEEVLNLNYY